jgi:Calcineurin-like phosphoesterase
MVKPSNGSPPAGRPWYEMMYATSSRWSRDLNSRGASPFSLTRRAALLAIAATAAVWSADPSSVEFVHLSDTHVTNLNVAHPGLAASLELKKDSAARFSRVLDSLARDVSPAFLLITGDLVDAYAYDSTGGPLVYRQIEVFQTIFDRSPIPIFPVLGNHDITQYHYAPDKPQPVTDQSAAAEARREWRRSIPNLREGTYYTFHKTAGGTGYLFIVLDDGEAKGRNEGYAAAELAWLKGRIAAHPRDAIILAMHIPLLQAPFWQGLKPILADAPNVVLSIAGHRHTDGVEEVDLGPRRLTQVRTAALFISDGNWRKLRLLPDRIEIFATGKPAVVEKIIEVKRAAALTGKLLVYPAPDAQVPLGPSRVRRLP